MSTRRLIVTSLLALAFAALVPTSLQAELGTAILRADDYANLRTWCIVSPTAPTIPTIDSLSDSTVTFTLEISKKGIRPVLPKRSSASLKALANWFAARCSLYPTGTKKVKVTLRFNVDGPSAPCRSIGQGWISPDLLLWDQKKAATTASEPGVEDFVEVETEPSYDENLLARLVRYPKAARDFGIEGIVVVGALISQRGCIEKIQVVESDHAILNDAAFEAVSNVRFTPARQNGKPVRVWVRIPIRFTLR